MKIPSSEIASAVMTSSYGLICTSSVAASSLVSSCGAGSGCCACVATPSAPPGHETDREIPQRSLRHAFLRERSDFKTAASRRSSLFSTIRNRPIGCYIVALVTRSVERIRTLKSNVGDDPLIGRLGSRRSGPGLEVDTLGAGQDSPVLRRPSLVRVLEGHNRSNRAYVFWWEIVFDRSTFQGTCAPDSVPRKRESSPRMTFSVVRICPTCIVVCSAA